MNFRKTLPVLFALLGATATVGLQAQKAKYVVLITIDGFRPDFYNDPSWGAVNMQEMKQKGVSAIGVNSTFPTLTFPNHTSIITGMRPAKHGVIYNENQVTDEWYWYSKDIKVPTLWDIVRKAGGRTASVNYPVSVGTTIDYNIPIYKQKGKSQLQVTRENSVPKGLFEEVEQNATGKLDGVAFNTEKDYLVMDENVARISGYLIKKYKPTLTTLRLSVTDHFEHAEGREGPTVRKAVAGADRAIRTIIEAVDQAGIADSTAIVITGDHGFVNTHTAVSPNTWLAKAGVITDEKNPSWQARFITAGGSAFLHLHDKNDKATLEKVKSVLAARNEQRLFTVLPKETLDKLDVDPDAVLGLAAVQGIAFVGLASGPEMRSVKLGTHGYYPDFKEIQTGFVAYGPGLRKGLVVPVMGNIDVGPLVAELLGLSLGKTDGILYPGMFETKAKAGDDNN